MNHLNQNQYERNVSSDIRIDSQDSFTWQWSRGRVETSRQYSLYTTPDIQSLSVTRQVCVVVFSPVRAPPGTV